MNGREGKRGIGNGIKFLVGTVVLYVLVGLVSPSLALSALSAFAGIVINILPVLFLVFGMMFAVNLLLEPRRVVRYLGTESGLRGWFFAVAGGILSAGPIYVWYPLLAELREKGMKDSLIAAFLYNRAVKIPLLPVMIYYFGWVFTIMLTFYMVVFSIINGLIVGFRRCKS
jgi:uncharacterized membrane protein YraQ (UPF0718 family)